MNNNNNNNNNNDNIELRGKTTPRRGTKSGNFDEIASKFEAISSGEQQKPLPKVVTKTKVSANAELSKSAGSPSALSKKSSLTSLTSKFEEIANKSKNDGPSRSSKMNARRAIKSERFENLASKFEEMSKEAANNPSPVTPKSSIPKDLKDGFKRTSVNISNFETLASQDPKASKRSSYSVRSSPTHSTEASPKRTGSNSEIIIRKKKEKKLSPSTPIDIKDKDDNEKNNKKEDIKDTPKKKSSSEPTEKKPKEVSEKKEVIEKKEVPEKKEVVEKKEVPEKKEVVEKKEVPEKKEEVNVVEEKEKEKEKVEKVENVEKVEKKQERRSKSYDNDDSKEAKKEPLKTSGNIINNDVKTSDGNKSPKVAPNSKKNKVDIDEQEAHLADIRLVDSGDLTDSPLLMSPERTSSQEAKLYSGNIEEVRFSGDLSIQGSGNVSEAPLITRIVLPVCLPSVLSRDFEDKKMKAIEKQSKRHAKEQSTFKLEDQMNRSKLEQELQMKKAQLEKEQMQEKELFQRKIQLDKQAVKELQKEQLRNMVRSLEKSNKTSELQLATKLNSQEKRTMEEFDRQISTIKKKKGDRESKRADEELINQLLEAHKKQIIKGNHMKRLEEVRLNHKHELEHTKRLHEIEKLHTFEELKLEKSILHQQLTLNQKHLREKQFQELDSLRSNHSLAKQQQKALQQLILRQEGETIDLASKLLAKQQMIERDCLEKNFQVNTRSASSVYSRQKKALKTDHLNSIKSVQKEKISKEKKAEKIEQLKETYNSQKAKLTQEFQSAQNLQSPDNYQAMNLKVRHEEQLQWLQEEQKKRQNAIILFHQKQKNFTEEKTQAELKQLEIRLQNFSKTFEEEEITLKNIFSSSNETRLSTIQQHHWKQLEGLQKEQHQAQQQALQLMLEASRISKSESLSQLAEKANNENTDENQAAINQLIDTDPEEEQLIQEQQKILEEEHEQEKLRFERERAQEQAALNVMIEEEKKEVMQTKAVEDDENTLKQEYIRKIAHDTGLSEELIAKQLNVIGFTMFRF